MAVAQTATAGEIKDVTNLFTGTEGTYLLPHHAKEIERLKEQHALILFSTGDVLVTAPLKQSKIKVLDCGASDGTWLLDLPRLYPQHEWSLHGVDIGSSLFPPNAGPQASLDLREFDIRSPTAPEPSWEQGFDLVHQRLLMWGLQKSEWATVVKNHFSLVKPGGWIQLVEGQWVERDHPFDPVTHPNLDKMYRMQWWCTENFGKDMFVAYRLEELLKEAGFKNVQKKQFTLGYGALAKSPEWKKRSVDMWIHTFRGLGALLPEGGIPGVLRNKAEFDELMVNLHAETLELGYAPRMNFVVAQKPE
ncbi:S-adenosyl-L-methionine-dependent methyltransferase [Chaetomium fimeti]|uniref:S-adenosyl-L-methionine-dependent methyltransferase n=1 Tax=Chaetomium fimeti TaxID=1854472 RepID=A0AAE0LQY4_9PEZI|nr:S-adenosyl-L-methionine-dependent methyltransferase [Chaetomium fimeti]